MKQKTINQNKLQTILCIIALTLGVLVSAMLFSVTPVHAEESNEHIYTLSNAADSSGSWPSRFEYSLELHSTVEIGLIKTNFTRSFVSGYSGKNVVKYGYFPIYLTNDKSDISGSKKIYYGGSMSRFDGSKLYDTKEFKYFDANAYATFYSVYYSNFTESSCTTYYNDGEVETDMKIFNSVESARSYVESGDTSGIINGESPNTTDESYSFTGFSINGKTARWTGTTERSYLKDQDVEEYTTITYAWATTTEPDNIGTFQEYNGEFLTSAKQLKLPWSDMESGKVDFQFIRQVNIIPCYRVPGAFYHGQAVKIFFKPDGSIEKVSDPNVTGVLDESIPIPILSVDNDQGTFVFTNAQNDYKFELKGRFWSTDDFYIYRNTPSLVWQYKYLTLLKNSLTTWVSVGDNKSVLDTFSFGDLGNESWQDLLNTYPIDQRNIITGQEQGWFSWANITGYNDAVSTLKMLLNSPYSLFNGYEVYVRYYVIGNDGIVKYSKWTHYFNNLASADGSTGSIVDDAGNMNNGSQSDKGLTDNDLNNVENSGNSRNDVDAKPSSDFGSVDIGDISGIFDQFLSVLKGLYSGMGQLPSFINAIFGFLPAWVTTMIGISIVIIIFLRILGR